MYPWLAKLLLTPVSPTSRILLMVLPEDLRYTTDHTWVRVEDSKVRFGLTEYAQDALGEIVFVELATSGSAVDQGVSMGEVESTKSVSDVYAPVAGVVNEVNDVLDTTPSKLNEDPYGDGWLCTITVENLAQLETLLDAAAYRELTGQ